MNSYFDEVHESERKTHKALWKEIKRVEEIAKANPRRKDIMESAEVKAAWNEYLNGPNNLQEDNNALKAYIEAISSKIQERG